MNEEADRYMATAEADMLYCKQKGRIDKIE